MVVTEGNAIHLLVHNILPVSLTKIFRSARLTLKKVKAEFFAALVIFHKSLNGSIWKHRTRLFDLWKEEHSITKQDFKDYRHNRSLTAVRSNTSRNRSYNAHAPVIYTVLNEHARPPSPISEWIVWTSSNFKHKSQWYSNTSSNSNVSLDSPHNGTF